MNINIHFSFGLVFAFVISMIFLNVGISHVSASVVPSLSLVDLGNSSVQIQVNADSHAQVVLYYYGPYINTPSSKVAGTVGQTGYDGTLVVNVTDSQYNIPAGAYAYVVVDGALSQPVLWPSYATEYPYSASVSYGASVYNAMSPIIIQQPQPIYYTQAYIPAVSRPIGPVYQSSYRPYWQGQRRYH